MAVVRCPKGHYYDDQRFSMCPHCGIGAGSESGNRSGKAPAAEEKKRHLFGWKERSAGAPAPQKLRDRELQDMELRDMELTVAYSEQQEDDQKTVSFYSAEKGNDYVTGWIVCVEGPEKGRDYRLHHGFNRIGRGTDMDVNVADDPSIARKSHCSIVYDGKTNQFSLVPSAGAITYYNGSLLSNAEQMQAGDEIRMGSSVFEFIPFCRKGRVWENGEDG